MQARLLTAALVGALAITLLLAGRNGIAQAPGGPEFSLAAQGNGNGVWVVDQRARRLRLCVPPLQSNQAPDCTEWNQLQ